MHLDTGVTTWEPPPPFQHESDVPYRIICVECDATFGTSHCVECDLSYWYENDARAHVVWCGHLFVRLLSAAVKHALWQRTRAAPRDGTGTCHSALMSPCARIASLGSA